jgi:g-D-glutamyl-meso-diaminopimelate peptidase
MRKENRYFLPIYKNRRVYSEEYLKKYPSSEYGIIGKSILAKEIEYFKIGCGNKHVIAVGAHHAMEHITASALYDFIEFLSKKLTRGESYCGVNIPFLLKKFSFWVIPCLNPDGVEMQLSGIEKTPLYERQLRMNCGSTDFSAWQANARGVDLNHNYGFGFFEYKRIEEKEGIVPGKTRYSGEYPESEPETRSLASFIRALAPTVIVSLHTQGEEIYSKPKTEYVEKISERLSRSVGYKSTEPLGLACYGGLCDYTGEVLGIPSFTVEVGQGKNPLPDSQFASICERVRKILVKLPTYL